MIILIMLAIVGIFLGYYFRPEIRNLFRKKEKIAPIPHEASNGIFNILERVSKSPVNKYYQDDYILAKRITQKIADLNDQLIRNRQSVDGFQLDIKDELRYEAMVEILKAMLDK